MAQYDVDIREYWRILNKRKLIVLLMIILVSLSSYVFARINEPKPLYESKASVKIERRTNMAEGLIGDFWYHSDNMATQAVIITSFPVLEQTAKYLGWIAENVSTQEIRDSKAYLTAINRLKSQVIAEHESGTNIINIRVISTDAQETAWIANAVVETYRDYNIREKNKQTFETKAFIESQLEITEKRLKLAEENLKAFKEQYDLVVLEAQTSNTLSKVFAYESEYEAIKLEKIFVETQLRLIQKAENLKSQPSGVFLPEKENSPIRELNSKLRDLFIQRQTLLFEFTEKHPKVIEINDQIHGIRSAIHKELSVIYQSLENRETDLLEKLKQLKQESKTFPEKSLGLNRLQRELSLQETLFSQLKTKYQETLIQASGKIEEVTIIKPAIIPSSPINVPSKISKVGAGFVMGIFLGIVFAFIAETLDTSIGTIEDVENLLHVPVLGVIPYLYRDETRKDTDRRETRMNADEHFPKSRQGDLITHYEPQSLAAEAFRSLRTNLQFMNLEKKYRSFLITSSFIQEGKTFNVANIAMSMAQAGLRVLLIEADLRNPSAHKIFGLNKSPGLTDYILGNYQRKEIVSTFTDVMLGDFDIEDILKTPGLENLHIITSGTTPPNPSEILKSNRFRDFIHEIYPEYDVIIIDAPPILPVADAVDIATLVDGVILVYTVGKIARGVVKRAKASLDNVNAKVLGVILNNVKPDTGPDYMKYQSQYYYGAHPNEIKPPGRSVSDFFRTPIRLSTIFKFIVLIGLLAFLIAYFYMKVNDQG